MTIRFRYKRSVDELAECDCCGCPAPLSRFPRLIGVGDGKARELCEFCASTNASRVVADYHTRTRPTELDVIEVTIWKAAACVFNKLKHQPTVGDLHTAEHVLDKE